MGKKKVNGFLLLATFVWFFVACTDSSSSPNKGTPIKICYAKHFSLQKKEYYTQLIILQPDNGANETTYALVKPKNKKYVPKGMKVIEIPVRNMTVLSTTHIGMLDAIGELDCIKSCCDASFIANKDVLDRIRLKEIQTFTDESSVTPEALLKSGSSLVIYSGFGKAFPQQEKLEKLGILTLANYDWREEHPLGKAEWVRLFGYLTDNVDQADAYFSSVEKTYIQLTKQLKQSKVKQQVLVGSLIGDVWFAPKGNSFLGRILSDAGCDYVYKHSKGSGSYERTLEQVYKDQQDAAIWIDAGARTLTDLKRQQSKYALFTAFRKGQVYGYMHNTNFFWEMAAVHPDWLLNDFARICGTIPGEPRYFYKQLEP